MVSSLIGPMRLASAPSQHSPRSGASWESAWRRPRRQRQTPSSMGAVETPGPRAERRPNQKSQTPYRDKPRSGAGSSGPVFLFFEKPLQIDAADGCGGGIEAPAHLSLLTDLFRQFGRNVKGFLLALNQHRDLVLRVKVVAVGAVAVGAAAGAFAFDKGAGQHFAERTETANESAAEFQVGVGGRFYMTLIIVSERDQVKPPTKICKN